MTARVSMKYTSEALCPQVTQPMKDYWKIKCVIGQGLVEDPCFKVCGLTCAEDCLRFFNKVCPGCPCLRNDEGRAKP